METLVLILLLVSAVCFLLAALNVAVRVNLLAFGLFFWVSVPLIRAFQGL